MFPPRAETTGRAKEPTTTTTTTKTTTANTSSAAGIRINQDGRCTTSSSRRWSSDGIVDSKEEDLLLLHCAASQGLTGAIQAILRAESEKAQNPSPPLCDRVDRWGRTALHWAAEEGHPDTVRALLRAGASVEPQNSAQHDKTTVATTPLMLAALKGHVEVARLLLEFGAGADDRDAHPTRSDHDNDVGAAPWRHTALHDTAEGGHAGIASVLLDAGFDREQRDDAGLTPVEISARKTASSSCSSSSAAVTFRLLPQDRGARLVHAYASMTTEDAEIVVAGLAEGGAFLDWQDEIGDSALHIAAHHQHTTIANTLIKAGADTNLRNRRGGSPLHVAACTGSAEIAITLLQAGADADARMVNGRSPLHLAAINNRIDVVKLLLEAQACTEHRDRSRGQTPLSEASEYCLAPIISLLLRVGRADVEARSSAGLTPLHWACRFNDVESVEALLAAGADPDAVDEAAAQQQASLPTSMLTRAMTSLSASVSSRCSKASGGMPVAEDVIGLGDPSRWTENPAFSFLGECPSVSQRRRDPAARKNIAAALERARYEHTWRRRGWLVILATRKQREVIVAPSFGGRQGGGMAVTGCGGFNEGVLLQGLVTGEKVRVLSGNGVPQRQGREKAGILRSSWQGGGGCHGYRLFKREGDDADAAAVGIKDAQPHLKGGSEERRYDDLHVEVGDGGVQVEDITVSGDSVNASHRGRNAVDLAETIDRVLGLATVELGVFRDVVRFL